MSFHLPAVVPFSGQLRLVQTDSSYISLGDIYDFHCERSGIAREDPLLFGAEKCRKVLREFRNQFARQVIMATICFHQFPNKIYQPAKAEYLTLKKSIFDEITAKMIPEDILTRVRGGYIPLS